MRLSAEEWSVLSPLLDEWLELPAARREGWLESLAEPYPGAKSRLREILPRAGEQSGAGVLETLPKFSLGGAATDGDGLDGEERIAAFQAGARIGHYELVRPIGAGGMGQVWLAEQTEPVRRTVALKLIRAGMYDETVVQRFRSERQSLAIMDHPAIAKVFDAGATAQGQPYLVMEYVPGLPITEYCDAHRLKIRERLEIFIQACEGVQHAHQKAVIHRDLKPANILIVEVDGKPAPRIIDFGIAKTSAPVAAEQTLLTRYGHFLGTPGFMSPEQVNPEGGDVDTRTDVYSLGVILYVLLTGLKPFESQRRTRPPLDEWLRQLREDEPPAPSGKLAAERSTAGAAAAARGTDAKQLAGLLRGDLDSITRKALERDRERRYGTPSELAADLRRHLDHQPVLARPASAAYQLKKFLRRHRLGAAVGGVVAVLALVAAGAGLMALEQRNLAVMEQAAADRIARFMVSLFELADPGENRGNSVTVREVLDRGAAEVEQRLEHQPAIRADLLTAMGQAYAGLGLYEPARKLLNRARADQTRADIPAESRVRTLVASGATAYLAADYAQAETLLREAVGIVRRELPQDVVRRSEAFDALADVLVQLEKYSEAEALCREALAADHQRGSEESAALARTLDTLGRAYFFSNDLPAAEKTLRQALALHRQATGGRDAWTAQAMNNLGSVLYQSGRFREAVALYREALPVYHAVYGAEHPEIAILLHNTGSAALMGGQIADAEPLLRQALAMVEKFKGPSHDDLVPPLNMLAMIDGYAGRMAPARAEIRRAERIARLPSHGVLLDEVLLNAADFALRDGRVEEAAALLAESRRLLEAAYPVAKYPAENWRYALWDTVDAELLARRGDRATAQRLVEAALPVIDKRFEPTGFNALVARRRAQFVGGKTA